MVNYRASEWVRCPECGYDEFSSSPFPNPPAGHNSHFECPECGAEGVVVG